MDTNRSRYGLLVSALGAVVLSVAVFLPWYGLSFTANGIALAQQVGDRFASQYGNATLQSSLNSFHANLSMLVGHQFVGLSAHQVLKDLNVVLLIVGGLAIVIAFVSLAQPESSLPNGSSLLALLGAIAAVCVLYRMVDPPSVAGGIISFSLREGSWLALLGSLAMVVGGMWPSSLQLPNVSPSSGSVWSEFSGWTPEA